MDKVRLYDSPVKVQEGYGSCDRLVELPLLVDAVDLLAEHIEDSGHRTRADVTQVLGQLL